MSAENKLEIAIDSCDANELKHVLDNYHINDMKLSQTLVASASRGYYNICKTLIEYGTNVNFQTIFGFTALICASKKGRLDIVKLLVDNGAKLTFRNYIGKTARYYASYGNHTDIIQLLKMVKYIKSYYYKTHGLLLNKNFSANYDKLVYLLTLCNSEETDRGLFVVPNDIILYKIIPLLFQ